MHDEPRGHEIVQMMAQNERAISALYSVFSEQLPAGREFWLKLAGEEREHAEWLDSLCDFVTTGKALRGWTRFPVADLEAIGAYTKEQIALAREKALEVEEAVATALQIENTLVEKEFFTVIETSSPSILEVLGKLAASTRDHVARLEGLRANPDGFR